LLSLNLFAQYQTVTGIMTDYNGYKLSLVGNNGTTANNSQNLLAFKTANNKYFTTGIDNSIVYSNNPSLPNCEVRNLTDDCISEKYFKSFPSNSLGKLTPMVNDANGKNLIGIPTNYLTTGGFDTNNYRYYLDDGKKGLDISTAIFNISLENGLITFEDIVIAPESINDGIPDIIVTQTGQTSTTTDKYFFNNEAGQLVGSQYSVSFGGVSVVAKTNYVFYYVDTNLPDTAPINRSLIFNTGSRDLRVLALDWADMGVTAANYQDIYSFNQLFNGASDVAFIAFNEESLFFKRNIFGNVKEVKIDGITRIPFDPANIVVELFLVKNGVVESIPIENASVDANGNYSFEDVLSNSPEESYKVFPRVINFNENNPYYVVENSDGTLNSYQEFKIDFEDIENVDFVLGNFCVKTPLKLETIGSSNPVAISTLNKQADNWPNAIPNAFLVLDSKEKGFVLPRTNAELIPVASLTEGMVIYDTTSNCVKLYDGVKWVCIERDCNEN